jgi:hypothetical protein
MGRGTRPLRAARAAALAALSVAALSVAAIGGCTAGPGSRPAPPPPDPHTVAALLRVAQSFNNAYDNGDFGAAYDRWDTRSKALISRAEYIRRHLLCAPATREQAVVTGAIRGPRGSWLVSYRMGGVRLTDTWYYARRRWVFDIVASNPGAARLYRLPFRRYVAATGCSLH